MKVKRDKTDVGIIVGRFQVPDLHEAHKELIQSICDEHDKVIVFLGLSPVFNSEDPLDFQSRQHMINEAFPSVMVAYIKDEPLDEIWSSKLDDQIRSLVGPKQSVTLYGGRDSFIDHYKGRYNTQELIQEHWVSGSEIRAMVKNQVHACREFRHGAIWASWQRFDTVYTTVDIAVIKPDHSQVLLARKSNEILWRFPGGFVDSRDENNEAAANRELSEEIPDIETTPITYKNYLGSYNIEDWRYQSCDDCIRTLFYYTEYLFGSPRAADDIAECKWFNVSDITLDNIVPNHRILYKALQDKVLCPSETAKEV